MGLGTLGLAFGGNWYDVVVIIALVYGVIAGVRNGFSGEILLVLGLLLMVALGLNFYPSVGAWVMSVSGLTIELANLIAFVGIAVLVYAVTLAIRLAVHRRLKQMKLTAAVENVGGGVAGLLRMLAVMAWVTVIVSLTRSPFWHEQVARDSRFGAFVVQQFPAVAEVTKKQFPEKIWFLKDLKRRQEPGVDEGNVPKKPNN